MDRIDNEIIYRHLRGETSQDEELLIEELYRKYPEECKDAFNGMHLINDLSELDSIRAKMERSRKRQIWKRTAGISAKVAAAAVVAVISGYIVQEVTIDSFSRQLTCIEAPRGEIIKVMLPDSTSVYLNSGARLQYPAIFRKGRRDVTLTGGEAMFEVKHDSRRPFIVNTFASEIEVLGTTFNVLVSEEENLFTTTLLEGKIALTANINGNRSRITMQPNDIIKIMDGRLEVTHDENPDICWTKGIVKIDGKTFTELMKDFERVFNISIVIDSGSAPDIDGARGKVRISDGIDNALKILQHTTGFEFTRDEETNTVTIY
ncbi:MAG: FecR family protein [Clostridium sp.]|nr:FecR family protein [Bacteroides sp.]MCM1198895.1 FecR family protein [Clostridium sp.]